MEEESVVDAEIAKSKGLNWFWTIGLIALVLVVCGVIIAIWVMYSKPVVLKRSIVVDSSLIGAVVYNGSVCALSIADSVDLTKVKSVKFVFDNFNFSATDVKKEYLISAADLGIANFNAIKGVRAEIVYFEAPPGGGLPVPDVNDSSASCSDRIKNGDETGVDCGGRCRACVSGGGGGGGGGDSGACVVSRDCSYYYNLKQCGNSLNDGCSDSLNCMSCNSGFYCNERNCINSSFTCLDSDARDYFNKGNVSVNNFGSVIFKEDVCLGNLTEFFCFYNGSVFEAKNESVNCSYGCANGKCNLPTCNSDLNCSGLSGVCGIGRCNLTLGSCYVNYSSGNVCRTNVSDCDAVDYCSGSSVLCVDNNKTNGSVCSGGSCQSGRCVASCTNDVGCSLQGGFCSGDGRPFNCTFGGDGCFNRVNLSNCSFGFRCEGGRCVVNSTLCVNDLNCSGLSGACGIGRCNFSSGNCYVNYSVGNVCRINVSDCDAVEICQQGLIDCPSDLNKTNGSVCSGGSCQSGRCVASCVNDAGCSLQGGFCSGDGRPFNCSMGIDGCLNRVNMSNCSSGFRCEGGRCVVNTTICIYDLNCSGLSGVCGVGICNLTSGSCYVNYSSGNVCRTNVSECDAVDYCSGSSVLCVDNNKTNGSVCSGGSCQNGVCISQSVCGDGICSVGENCPADIIGCQDTQCYEPSCTNGCVQNAVTARGNDETCLLPNYCNGNGNCVNCISSNDCASGLSCIGGNCVNIGSCSVNSDCTYRGPGFACNSSNHNCEWIPPIGIPKPEFGIEETYRMYDNTANRNPALNYTRNAEGGYYTHYVDNSNFTFNCSDTNNAYGNMSRPRCTIPINLLKGSVVELGRGIYNFTNYQFGGKKYLGIIGNGSLQQPIFIRGSGLILPIFINEVYVRGQYIIMENFNFSVTNYSVGRVRVNAPNRDISLRNSYAMMKDHDNISYTTAFFYTNHEGNFFTNTTFNDNIIFYNNYIHDLGGVPGELVHESTVGVSTDGNERNFWIVDNKMENIGEDGVQIYWGHHNNTPPQYIYIGRNIIKNTGENSLDIKQSQDVIISQNDLSGAFDTDYVFSGSDGAIIVVNDEPPTFYSKNIWIIFNKIHNGNMGARYQMPANFIGNLIYNIIPSMEPYFPPLSQYYQANGLLQQGNSASGSKVIGNTIFNSGIGAGFVSSVNNTGYIIYNNLISNRHTPGANDVGFGNSVLAGNSRFFNNLLFYPNGSINFRNKPTNESHIEANPRFVNVPQFCRLIHYNITKIYDAQIIFVPLEPHETFIPGAYFAAKWPKNKSVIYSPSVNFTKLGVIPGDWVDVDTNATDGNYITYKIAKVFEYNLTLRHANSMSEGIFPAPLSVAHYPNTTTDLYLENVSGFAVGGYIEYGDDGIPRQIERVEGNKIILRFSDRVIEGIRPIKSICYWGLNTNVTEDFRLLDSSPAINAGNLEIMENIANTFYLRYGLNISRDIEGKTRPQGLGWDIGAYEYSGTTLNNLTSEKSSGSFLSKIYKILKMIADILFK